MSIGDAADKPRDCRARPLPLNRLQLQSTRSVTSGMPPALRIPIAHRLFGGALGLALAVALAGCGGQAGCDSEAVIEKAIAAVRANYPNDVSKELLKRGSVAALDRILREKKLDYKDEKQLEVGARAAVKEMEEAWKNGRFTIESVATVEYDAKANKSSCRARMVFMTSWGISVRDVSYDATIKSGHLDVTAAILN